MHWFDGRPKFTDRLQLSVNDPALICGATVFTTLRVYAASLEHPSTAWGHHCDRLRQSLHHLGWSAPDWSQVKSGAEHLAAAYPILRIALFPDGRELVTGRNLPEDLPARQANGITAWVADQSIHHRALPAHKTGNYLGCWQAIRAAAAQGAQEAILINQSGQWLETATGSLWGWSQGTWCTPPLAAGILPGITRSRLLAGLRQQGSPPQIASWRADQPQQFEVLAYTNSVVECVPIHTVLAGRTRLEYDPKHPALGALLGLLRPSDRA
ncbi:4-amino-4-deoxychorismate lyase [filamentous cyanobacterium CCP5]|nr:4-amino-4-deoxychorismate lyase [filamentous cyanobacterium CCP5]